jgi:hypothetical protein
MTNSGAHRIDHRIGHRRERLARSAQAAAAIVATFTSATLLLLIAGPGAPAKAASPASVHSPASVRGGARAATRLLNATDTAHLHLVKSPGTLLLEEGPASGALPGSVKARCDVGPTVTAKFTIYTHGGTIRGEGSGKLSPSGEQASFGGSMTVTGGSGRYAHAHGHGGFYGVLNRYSDAMTIQTTGALSY